MNSLSPNDDVGDMFWSSLIIDDSLDGAVEVVAAMMAADSSDEDEPGPWGGSHPGKLPNKNRNFAVAYDCLVRDYFSGMDSVYDEQDFERRFRMPRCIFEKVQGGILGCGSFVQRTDCTGKPGIHPLCRLTAVLRMIAYGECADREDEYLRLSESVTSESVKEFARHMVDVVYGKQYLYQNPTEQERQQILKIFADRGDKLYSRMGSRQAQGLSYCGLTSGGK